MARGPIISEADKAKAVAMRRGGATLQEIATRLGCTVAPISRILAAAEKAGEKLPAAKTGRLRTSAKAGETGTSDHSTRVRQPRQRGAQREHGADPTDPDSSLADLRADLAEIAEARRDLFAQADLSAGTGDLRLYRDLAELELALGEKLRKATPPEPPNPEADPLFAAAKQRLIAKAMRIVAREQGGDVGGEVPG
jgi:hypothetical protein